jgi:filamentous hemagglutinin
MTTGYQQLGTDERVAISALRLQGLSLRGIATRVGRDLTIHSVQDTATYDSQHRSAGGSVTIGYGFAASANYSQARVEADHASVSQHSGLRAGDQGFQVEVQGHTELQGALIASTQAAVDEGRNRLATGTLGVSDITNHSEHEARGISLSGGFSYGGSGKQGSSEGAGTGSTGTGSPGTSAPAQPSSGVALQQFQTGSQGVAAGYVSDSSQRASTTRSGISGGELVITDAAAQQERTGQSIEETLASVNRDMLSSTEANGLTQRWDGQQLQQQVQAGAQIVATFGRQASKAVGDYAGEQRKALQEQARNAPTEAERQALLAEADKWDEGGAYRVAAHIAVGGLSGGLEGALGSGSSAAAAQALNEMTADLPQGVRQAVGAGIAAGLGALTGGPTGAATAFNADVNNRQLHPSEKQWIKDNAKRFAQQQGISEQEAEQRLAQQAFRQVQFGAEGAEDAQARAFLGQAHGMLTADPGCPSCGPGYMFYATPEQRANAGMYAGTLPQTAEFYQSNKLTQPTLEQIVTAATTDSAQRNRIAQQTVLAAVAAGTLALAPSLSGVATEAAAFARNPVGYCLGNPAACTVAAETAAYTAAGVPQPGSGLPVKAGGSNPAGRLTYDAVSDSWASPGGLVYGQGSAHGNRVLHVLDHTIPNSSKPVHSVFNVDRTQVIGLVDEAWAAKVGPGTLQANGNRVWVVDMGRQVGTGGQTSIQIVVRDGTTQLITAFPK